MQTPVRINPHGFKHLDTSSWLEPDVPRVFPAIPVEKWVEVVTGPRLSKHVPENVEALFEVARGSILYGWFFYPLCTLATEQLFRVQETAIRERCKRAGIPIHRVLKNRSVCRNLAELIDALVAAGVIPQNQKRRWSSTRSLRNSASHPERQMILTPGDAAGLVKITADQINALFVPPSTPA